jgi:hypothetical protein
VASVLIQDEVDSCGKEIRSRWIEELEGVDIRGIGCRAALKIRYNVSEEAWP